MGLTMRVGSWVGRSCRCGKMVISWGPKGLPPFSEWDSLSGGDISWADVIVGCTPMDGRRSGQ